ncbi:unnamed protein product [Echinostoma caproni]|uniref:MMS1_N domain-containing protein n=1 Tax=Echinostoma caproni TaxID=27848 RepID=A0A183ARC6_9TREM|nr:unnamed protein product [Echinostoma caproni]
MKQPATELLSATSASNEIDIKLETATCDEPLLKSSTGEIIPSTSLTVFCSHDPATGQILFTRPEDGLMIVKPSPHYPGSGFIVQHADGTRQTLQIYTTHSKGGQVNVLSDGSIFYSSPLSKLSLSNPSRNPMVVAYGMRSDGVSSLLEAVDPQGNAFTVDALANCNVMLTVKEEPPDLSPDQDPNPMNTDNNTVPVYEFVKIDEHIPMLFHINPQRQEAKQLLRITDVTELFSGARQVSTTPSEWAFIPFQKSLAALGTSGAHMEPTCSFKQDTKSDGLDATEEDYPLFVQESLQNDSKVG